MHGDRIRVSHKALSTMRKLCRDGWRVPTRPNAQLCSLSSFAWALKHIGHSPGRLRYKTSRRLRRWSSPITAHRLPQQLASQYPGAKGCEKLFQLLFNPNPYPFPSSSSPKRLFAILPCLETRIYRRCSYFQILRPHSLLLIPI
jgi:hypothetical protein